jgi:hypothetical protein
MHRWCVRSLGNEYRWVLGRRWSDAPWLVVVGLNPSTADARSEDPTTRRCIGFARRWGHGGLMLVNLYGLRATKPRELRAAGRPIGKHADRWLLAVHRAGGRTLAAWGNDGLGARADAVRALLGPLWVLGLTQRGAPRHPLYVRGDVAPQLWEDARRGENT